jgi:hypothetical protein
MFNETEQWFSIVTIVNLFLEKACFRWGYRVPGKTHKVDIPTADFQSYKSGVVNVIFTKHKFITQTLYSIQLMI